jgi:hypothetical protein
VSKYAVLAIPPVHFDVVRMRMSPVLLRRGGRSRNGNVFHLFHIDDFLHLNTAASGYCAEESRGSSNRGFGRRWSWGLCRRRWSWDGC